MLRGSGDAVQVPPRLQGCVFDFLSFGEDEAPVVPVQPLDQLTGLGAGREG